MTPEEREAYVGQDEVKRGWREIPSSDRLERLDAAETLADVARPALHLPEDAALRSRVGPVAAECLRLFYGDGKSYNQIARLVTVRYEIGGELLEKRPLTKDMVRGLIRSARKTLLMHTRKNGKGE